MINIANLPDNERQYLFQNTSEKTKLSEAIVEKDFWVCYMLDYLFNRSPWKDNLIFKGGTSLSKAFHLIERFSEDIDLIIDWRLLGYTLYEPWQLSRNQIDKKTPKKTQEFLINEFVPKLQQQLSIEINDNIRLETKTYDNKNYAVNFYYPMTNKERSYIRPVICLEIGMLAAWTPYENQTIVPYAAEYYRNFFINPETTIPTSSPLRTFWEKASILHREASRPENKPMPERYSRHYYDIYSMLQNKSFKSKVLKSTALLSDVAKFSQKFYYTPWVDYDKMNIRNLKLIPSENRQKEIRSDYEEMQEMIFGERPSLDDIFSCLSNFENELHGCKDS